MQVHLPLARFCAASTNVMSLRAKIEAVTYASEEPVTLQQLVGLLGDEAAAELDRMAAEQGTLPLATAADASEGTLADAPGELTESSDAVSSQNEQPGSLDEPSELDNEPEQAADAAVAEPEATVPLKAAEGAGSAAVAEVDAEKRRLRERDRAVREHIRRAVDGLIREYAEGDRGIEIREVASGYRMATKPEYHDAVRGFVKSLKPALKLTLPALETLAVVAYKQPVTTAEITEIRGVDSAGVLGGLLARKLIATAGRKQVIGRPMLYKTTREFLLRFGLKDVNELPSMDEFERLAGELVEQEDLPMQETGALIERANVRGDAEHIRDVTGAAGATDEPREDAAELDDTDESDDALAAEAAADASEAQTGKKATAASAAGGHHGRDNEPTAAAPLHTTQAGEPTPGFSTEQADSADAGPATIGTQEGERRGPA